MVDEKNIMKMIKSKGMKNLIGNIQIVSTELLTAVRTYMGEYDKDGNTIEKGDRHYYFENLTRILEKLEKIEKTLEEINDKLNKP